MSGHTPGPWLRVEETVYALDETGTCNRFTTQVQAGYLTAPNGWSTAERVKPDETEANARLIAAAPDLLEALQALLAPYADAAEKAKEVGVPLDPDCESILAKARAALAKAGTQ